MTASCQIDVGAARVSKLPVIALLVICFYLQSLAVVHWSWSPLFEWIELRVDMFSPKTIEALEYYVYIYSDPVTKVPFYVVMVAAFRMDRVKSGYVFSKNNRSA